MIVRLILDDGSVYILTMTGICLKKERQKEIWYVHFYFNEHATAIRFSQLEHASRFLDEIWNAMVDGLETYTIIYGEIEGRIKN